MRIPFLELLLAAFLIALLPATANSFDVSKKNVGDVTRWSSSNGNISVTYLGSEDGLYKFAFKRDASKGYPLALVSWSNRNGDTVRAVIGTEEITHTPHDCSLTLGQCRNTERHSRYGSRKLIWNSSVKNGVWHYTKHHTRVSSKTLLEKGTFTVDQYGYPIDRDYELFSNGVRIEKGWTRRR